MVACRRGCGVWRGMAFGLAAAAVAAEPGPWRELFNGRDLEGWKRTEYVRPGEIRVLEADRPADAPPGAPAGPAIYLGAGDDLTGITYTNPAPTMNYEVRLDAMRVSGGDFFCGLTLPYGTNCFTLVVGGWGGTIVGISSIDGLDASENETSLTRDFETGRWYSLSVRVMPGRIEADLDGKQVIAADVAGRRVHMRPGEIEIAVPLAISTWRTAGAVRGIRLRERPPPPDGP